MRFTEHPRNRLVATRPNSRPSFDYYEAVERVTGGRRAAQAFARLFIVPGMNHATGSDGALAIDYLTAIELCVAKGQAPAMLVAAHVPKRASGLKVS